MFLTALLLVQFSAKYNPYAIDSGTLNTSKAINSAIVKLLLGPTTKL